MSQEKTDATILSASGRALSPSALSLSASVGEAYASCLSVEGGFLPPTVPAQKLPPPFGLYSATCLELATHYHGGNAHVRPWLDECMTWKEDWAGMVDELDEPELNGLMTALCTLAHAYRWDSAPPRSEEYRRSSIDLPPALSQPWGLVARRLGIPRVGNLYHMVLNNWRLKSRASGGAYTNAEVAGENVEIVYSYLLPPARQQMQGFFASVIETESRGALILRTLVGLLSAAARRNADETMYLLDKLRGEIQNLTHVFSIYVRKQVVAADTFLTLIQPTLVWGLDQDGTGILDGASGSQMPILQALDAGLGLRRESHTGLAILKGRQYLLPAHRRFLAALDEASPLVRAFVEECGWPKMTELFNECVEGVQFWRRMHQKRGALYIKGDTPGSAPDYVSVGKTVAAPEDRVRIFEDAMQQRLQETTDALFHTDGVPADLQTAFQYLTPKERDLLVAGAQTRTYAAGETILEEGSRRQGIFIVRSGMVRVVAGPAGRRPKRDRGQVTGVAQKGLAIAHLGEGELFGEMSFLENQGASSSVLAVGECTIDVIEREHVYQLLTSARGFRGRFLQSLAMLLSQRLRRANALLQLSLEKRPPPERPHSRRTGPLQGGAMPENVRRQLDAFGATLSGAEILLAEGTGLAGEAQTRVSAACDALPELLRGYVAEEGEGEADGNSAALHSIYREAFPWLMRSEIVDRLFHLPPGCPLDQATLECLRRSPGAGNGDIGLLVNRWCQALPTIQSLREAPVRFATIVERLRQSWAGSGTYPLTGVGVGCAAWLPELLATANIPDLQLTCLDADDAALARGAERAGALGVAQRVQFIPDDVLPLAWGQVRPVALQRVVLVDNLLHFLRDRDAVMMLDWVHASLGAGGVAVVSSLAPDAPDRPFFDHILNWGLMRRDAEELSDLFTRSAFGADPVDVEMDETGAALYATCTKREPRPSRS